MIETITNNLHTSGCFGDVTVKSYAWSETLSGERYIKALRTFSSHHGIDEALRDRLYKRIHDVIRRYDGEVSQPRSVVLFHSMVKK